jgi:hypothetical protein
LWKKAHRKPGEGEVKIVFGGFVEDLLSEGRRGFQRGAWDGPEEDVELGRVPGSEEVFGFCETLMEFEGGGVASFEAFCKVACPFVWEQLLGGPESNSRGSGTGTFE